MKKIKRRIFVALTALFLLAVLFIASFNQLLPIVNARAVQYSRSHATKIINSAVKAVLEERDVSGLVSIRTDGNGNVLALSSDTYEINRLKSDVSLKILELLSQDVTETLKIPVGNLTGMYLLSGKGFGLSIRLIPTNSILTEVEGSFSEVGINQSWHRLTLKVTVNLGVIILGRHNDVEICDSIVISDTVIVGRVPDSYTDIEKIDDETLGDIVDFRA